MNTKHRLTTWILLSIAVIIVSRMPSFFEPILNIDEADFAVQTAVWMEGGTPYVDFVEKKPPIIHMAYALAFYLGGTWNMLAAHLLFTAIVIATAILLMLVAKMFAGDKTAIAALILFAVYQAGYDLNDFLAANTETLMNLFSAAALLFFIIALKGGKRTYLLICGIATGLATLSKPVGIAILPGFFLALIAARKREERSLGKDASLGIVGFLIPLAICALYLYRVDAISDALRWVWHENLKYAAHKQHISTTLSHAITRVGIYMLASLPLWILAGTRIVQKIKSKNKTPAEIAVTSWLIVTFIAVSIGRRFFPHYFIQFLPNLILLAALGWTGWLLPKLVNKPLSKKALIYIFVLLPIAGFFFLHVHEVRKIDEKYTVERTVAKAVAEKTNPNDRIFVWGHNSDIYFYAKRLPSSRFTYCSYLTGASEGFEASNETKDADVKAWEMLMSDLDNNKPALIVDMSGTGIRGYDTYPISAFSSLRDFVLEGYSIGPEIAGAILWMRNKPN